MTHKDIATQLGVPASRVGVLLRLAGVHGAQGSGGSLNRHVQRRCQAMDLLGSGTSVSDTANMLDVSPATLRTWHDQMSMSILHRGRRGGARNIAGHSVGAAPVGYKTGRGVSLSMTGRTMIAQSLGQGMSAAGIARQIGRHRSVISREINRGSVEGIYTAVRSSRG